MDRWNDKLQGYRGVNMSIWEAYVEAQHKVNLAYEEDIIELL